MLAWYGIQKRTKFNSQLYVDSDLVHVVLYFLLVCSTWLLIQDTWQSRAQRRMKTTGQWTHYSSYHLSPDLTASTQLILPTSYKNKATTMGTFQLFFPQVHHKVALAQNPLQTMKNTALSSSAHGNFTQSQTHQHNAQTMILGHWCSSDLHQTPGRHRTHL